MKRLALAALLVAAPALCGAQQSTADRLRQAIDLYEAFNVEAARPILTQIISPSYLQQVTAEQRATAYKYLGASYAVLAQADSAQQFFIAALDFDPFTDLDPTKFAQTELDAFTRAKSQIFKVAVAQMPGPALLRPQPGLPPDSGAYTFRVISTKRSNMRVRVQHQTDTSAHAELYNGSLDGTRNMPWRGQLDDGRYAPEGVYQLLVEGSESQSPTAIQRQQLAFRIEHIREPLEDTLPELNPADSRQLLPEQYPRIAPWQDLARGLFVGGMAMALPLALQRENISGWGQAAFSGTLAIGTGVTSWWYRRRNPQIQLNVAENQRRREARRRFNDEVTERNRDRERRTLLIISPVSTAQ